MTTQPEEFTQIHTRLMKCTLEIDESRAYWAHTDGAEVVSAQQAFDDYWFGARSLPWVKILLTNMRIRFDAFPMALQTLHKWPHMSPDTRRSICHWHLQLADPLYRAFTGNYLVSRRQGARTDITRDVVVQWVSDQGPDRWTIATRIQFASKLLSASRLSGLVATNRDPRPLTVPRVSDEALDYMIYLLREIQFDGTLLDNPYLASMDLKGAALDERLRHLPSMDFRRQADLVDFGWRYANLSEWSTATLGAMQEQVAPEQAVREAV